MSDDREEGILRRLADGEMKPREIEAAVAAVWSGAPWSEVCDRAVALRRRHLEREHGVDLDALGAAHLPAQNARPDERTRIEGCVGAASVPLGVAGPLPIRGDEAEGSYLVPLATNEAALVAGLSRGASVLRRSGGVETSIEKDGMTRAPLLRADRPEDLAAAFSWVETDAGFDALAGAAGETTSHGSLEDVEPILDPEHPRHGYLRFRFHTGDAMGMNMATIASEAACLKLLGRFEGLEVLALSGNLCSDKKQTRINVERGRGLSIRAEARVDPGELERLGAPAARIALVHFHKNVRGGDLAGTIGGYNAHAANAVAAIFCATGQDLAQVVESASCRTDVRDGDDGALHLACDLPCIEVGTVGGGTDTPTARAALDLLGVAGGGDPPGRHRRILGEVVAAAVLAGELNLLAALARQELASSHARLRGKPDGTEE